MNNNNAITMYQQQLMLIQQQQQLLALNSSNINNFNYHNSIYTQQFMYYQQLNNNVYNAPTAKGSNPQSIKTNDQNKTTNNKVLSLDPEKVINQLPNDDDDDDSSIDSPILSPIEAMTPNTIKSLLSASEYNPDSHKNSEEKESFNKSKETNKNDNTEKDKNQNNKNKTCQNNKKSKLKAGCAEFVPSRFLIKHGRQLSAIEEDQEEDFEAQDFQVKDVNYSSFDSQES